MTRKKLETNEDYHKALYDLENERRAKFGALSLEEAEAADLKTMQEIAERWEAKKVKIIRDKKIERIVWLGAALFAIVVIFINCWW